MILFCDAATSAAIPSSLWTTYLPLASPIVVIFLFLIDRIIGFYLRKREIERNWYLKVLIEPGITKISDFYKKTNETYATSAELLQGNSSIAHEAYLSLKSKEIGKFQSYKRELEAEVILPIQMRYTKVGEHLTESLLNLEDCFTSSLDKGLFSEQDIKDFQSKIASNRAILLNQLYSPLQRKLFSFKK